MVEPGDISDNMRQLSDLTLAVQALGLGLGLVLVSVTIQGVSMAGIARLVGRAQNGHSFLYLPVTVAALVTLHLAVVCIYAAAYLLASGPLALGGFRGEAQIEVMDVFYFSLITYSTLGLGDLMPDGPLRLIVGVEVLNGFLLLTSSATFLFYSMGLLRPFPPSGQEIRQAAEKAEEAEEHAERAEAEAEAEAERS